ncbi:MAG: aminotransferase class IV [Syntrophomonadaceae bacterium]
MEISTEKFWLKDDQFFSKEELPGDFIEQGTSLYEVIRVMQGVPLFFEQHMARLHNTSQLTGLKLPVDDETIKKRLFNLITRNEVDAGNIKIVLNYRQPNEPAVFYAYFTPSFYPSPADYEKGVKTVLVNIERPNPNAKVDRAEYRHVIDTAKEKTHSYEAILVDHNGFVTEGGRSNVFMIKDNLVLTPPPDQVLKGINRQMVMVACNNIGQPVIERKISLQEMLTMDAVFITGTSPHVLPVSQVDEYHFDSANNQILKNIMSEFDNIVDNYIKSHRPD